MAKQATVAGLDLPTASQVTVKIEVSTDVNISTFTARQKANRFLVTRAGDQLCRSAGAGRRADTVLARAGAIRAFP